MTLFFIESISSRTGVACSESRSQLIRAGQIITRELLTFSLMIRLTQYWLSSGEAPNVQRNGDLLRQNMNCGNKLNSRESLKLFGSSFLNSANLATSLISILSSHLITSMASSEKVLKMEYLERRTAAVSWSKPQAISLRSSGFDMSLWQVVTLTLRVPFTCWYSVLN